MGDGAAGRNRAEPPHIRGMDNEALDRAIRATLRRLHEAPEWGGRLQAICDRIALRDQAMLRAFRKMGP
jgi:hypothetical protein